MGEERIEEEQVCIQLSYRDHLVSIVNCLENSSSGFKIWFKMSKPSYSQPEINRNCRCWFMMAPNARGSTAVRLY